MPGSAIETPNKHPTLAYNMYAHIDTHMHIHTCIHTHAHTTHTTHTHTTHTPHTHTLVSRIVWRNRCYRSDGFLRTDRCTIGSHGGTQRQRTADILGRRRGSWGVGGGPMRSLNPAAPRCSLLILGGCGVGL